MECLVEVYLLVKVNPSTQTKLVHFHLGGVRSTCRGDIISEGEPFGDLIIEHECGHACHRVGVCPTQSLWGAEETQTMKATHHNI